MENTKINSKLGVSTSNIEHKKCESGVTNPISAVKRTENEAELWNSLDALAMMNKPLIVKRYAA